MKWTTFFEVRNCDYKCVIFGHGALLLEYCNVSFINRECVLKLQTRNQQERSSKCEGRVHIFVARLRDNIHAF